MVNNRLRLQRSAPVVPCPSAMLTRKAIVRCVPEPASRGRNLVPLPDGGGFLFPCTNDLFGPGYAFRMSGSDTSSLDHLEEISLGIVPYKAPSPPIVSEQSRSKARVVIYRRGESAYEFKQIWDDAEIQGTHHPVGLLPQPEIAGVLPSPRQEEDESQVPLS